MHPSLKVASLLTLMVSATTDKQGRARISVRNEGLNIIAARATLPMADGSPVAQQSLFSSLTFLGEPHHE